MVDHYTKKMCLVQLLEKHMDGIELIAKDWVLSFGGHFRGSLQSMWNCGLPQKVFMFVCSIRVYLVICDLYKITELKCLCLIKFTVMTKQFISVLNMITISKDFIIKSI